MNKQEFTAKNLAEELLEKAGLPTRIQKISPIYSGGNNQLHYVQSRDAEFILKKYFIHPNDSRDRLRSEYNFLKIAYDRCPANIPRTFAKDLDRSIALYEFIDGTTITSAEQIDSGHIFQAADFIRRLNLNKNDYIDKIDDASEACFSIDEHINLVQGRVDELKMVPNRDIFFTKILSLLDEKWLSIKEKVHFFCQSNYILTSQKLEFKNRILSPSDFGFHNAIIKKNKDIVFIDFEYAGWDDPAKMVGDFFNQVAIPINTCYKNTFLDQTFNFPSLPPKTQIRTSMLIDVYRIKWCCIILNIFLENHLRRRIFSNPQIDIKLLKMSQLNKAKFILESYKA